MKRFSISLVLLVALPLMLASTAVAGVLDRKLIEAARDGRINDVIAALDQGANINTFDQEYGTALTIAIGYEHPDVAKLLIARGADVNQIGYTGATPLMIAAEWGVPDLVRILLQKGANVNTLGHFSSGTSGTALSLAREMLEKGHDQFNLDTGRRERVPLSPEEKARYQEIEKMLKKAGAK